MAGGLWAVASLLSLMVATCKSFPFLYTLVEVWIAYSHFLWCLHTHWKTFSFRWGLTTLCPLDFFFSKQIHLLWKSPFHPKLCQDIRCHPLCSSIKSVFQVTSTCYQYSIQGVLQVTSACCQRSIQSVLQVTVTNVVSRASSKLLQDVINVGTKSVFQVTSTWYQCSIKDVVLGTLLPPPHPTPPHPTNTKLEAPTKRTGHRTRR